MNKEQQQINELASLMEEHNIAKMEYSSEELSLSFSKLPTHSSSTTNIKTTTEPSSIQQTPLIHPTVEPTPTLKGTPILSPLTGIFYMTSDPNSPPFVSPGDHISQGQIIGLVEAMKVFNEILAPYSGTVSEYCIQHGQLVQNNEPILYIETDSSSSL